MNQRTKKEKRIHKWLFLRYIVLYLVFSIVILGSVIPLYLQFTNTNHQHIVDMYQTSVNDNALILDNTVSALFNAINVTYVDSRLRTFRYINTSKEEINVIDFNALTDSFNGLLISHDLVADAAIIFSENIVLSRKRTFTGGNIFNYYPQFLKCANLSYIQWRGLLNSHYGLLPAMQYYSSDYGRYEGITFAYPWTDQFPGTSDVSGDKRSIFFAIIPVKRVTALLMDPIMQNNGYFSLSASDGSVLYEYGKENRPNCTLISVQTPLWKISIEFGIPESMIDADMAPVKSRIIIFSLLMFVLSFVMILLFAYRSSRPISRIMNTMTSGTNTGKVLEKQISQIGKRSPQDFLYDYKALNESLQDIDRSIDSQNRIIEEQQSLIRYQMMDLALRSGLFRPEEQEQFYSNFPDFPEQYRLSLFFYNNTEPDDKKTTGTLQFLILERIRALLPDIYMQGFEGSAILMLLPEAQNETKDWNSILSHLKEEIAKDPGTASFFTISNIYSSPQDLSRAYQQVQYFNVFSAYNRYSLIEDPASAKLHSVRLPLGIGEVQILYNALSNGNIQAALNTLSECIGALPELFDYTMYKHTYTLLFNLLTQLKLENPSILFDAVIPAFSQIRNKTDYIRQFEEAFRIICELIHEARQTNIDDYSQKIMAYIDQNICNPDLCVNFLTDQFSISAPTLQKIVRRATEHTFSDYVESQRLSMAHQLLTTGNSSVHDVAEQCGFSSANSFYKVFKRKYGISPSSFMPDSGHRPDNAE